MKSSTMLSVTVMVAWTFLAGCESCRSKADSKQSESGSAATAGEADHLSPLTDALAGDIPHRDAACRACRAVYCTKYDGVVDLVTSCFGNKDPQFIKQCIAVQNCAYEKKCGYKVDGASECFCGTEDVPSCLKPGAANGPCQAEWLAAARAKSVAELAERFGDLSLPAGVSNYLLACDRDYCKMCKPQGL